LLLSPGQSARWAGGGGGGGGVRAVLMGAAEGGRAGSGGSSPAGSPRSWGQLQAVGRKPAGEHGTAVHHGCM
jgi:hypothetical protein